LGKLRDLAVNAAFRAYNLTARTLPVHAHLPAGAFPALEAFFDKTWVLTIERNAERQREFRKRFPEMDFEFFFGVDGKSLANDDSRLDLKEAQLLNHRNVHVNELACTMSHLVMFKEIVERNLNRVLIFEDDAILLEKNAHWISYCLERLPSDWELFYLGYREGELRGFTRELQELFGRRRNPNEVVSRSVGRGIRTAAGHDYTHSYAVTRTGAEKLLGGAYPVVHTADGWLENKILRRDVRAYISVPKIFVQGTVLKSTIHNS
jgi:glycosyl transferase, family 25